MSGFFFLPIGGFGARLLFCWSGHLNLLSDGCHSLCRSYIVGMVLSILGTVMLIIGSLASFAGACSMSFFLRSVSPNPDPPPCSSFPLPTIVLYGLGTVVSLIGTGFLIGVRLNFFSAARTFSEQETVPKAVETSKLTCVLTPHPVVHRPSHPPSSIPRIIVRCSSPSALSRRSYSWP
jgi:hypothetical protein